jgi:chromosome partitioning protein
MPVVVVANPKGGVGKSTLSTQIAGYFASKGHSVMIGDADRQQSSRLWLGLRPPAARRVTGWDVSDDGVAKPPKGTSHVVLDTPAGLHGKRLKEVLKIATHLVVPLQPSVFDIFATKPFLDDLAASSRAEKFKVGIVGMRVDERTRSAE